jgi:hypothetical protein
MKLPATLAILACATLLWAAVMGSARQVHAQDEDATDQDGGSWSAPGDGSPDDSNPEAKLPINLSVCWYGTVKDKHDGKGSAFFAFDQDGTVLESDSNMSLEWPDMAFAEGPMAGSVSAKGIKFEGSVGTCGTFSGSATGNASKLTGKIKFIGECGTFLKDVTFKIKPGECPI